MEADTVMACRKPPRSRKAKRAAKAAGHTLVKARAAKGCAPVGHKKKGLAH